MFVTWYQTRHWPWGGRFIFSAFLFSGFFFSSLFCGPRPFHFPTQLFSLNLRVPSIPRFPVSGTPARIILGQIRCHLGRQRGGPSLHPSPHPPKMFGRLERTEENFAFTGSDNELPFSNSQLETNGEKIGESRYFSIWTISS